MEASQSLEKNDKMPWPIYAEVFKLEEKFGDEKNWAFSCKVCIGKKIIHASKTSTANLRKHIRAKHSHLLENIDKAKLELSNKRSSENPLNIPNKYQKLERESGCLAITQKTFDKAIIRFIIEDIQPLSIVESPAFINLLRIGLPSQIRIMCRKTLRQKLCDTYFKMKATLNKKLTEIELVATTADLWSKAKRSYLGITIHWINPETLVRESAALACRRMKGRHTYDVLAQAINSVFLEYHIQNKVCCTTTDNGSNFVKAFRTFEKDEDEIPLAIEFHNLNELLIMDDIEDTEDSEMLTLPPHHRCVSHTLNLIAVKDSEKATDNVSYKKLYRLTFAKLTKLWNKQNQSTQVSDKIKELCGVYLKTPVITRWNSNFDSMQQLLTLLKNDPEKINQCLDYCDLQRLTENEIQFIEEYCQIMKPLAQALDILQGDTGMYMGYLLPVFTKTLKEKLENFNKSEFIYCQPLIAAIQQGLNKKFSTLFERKEFIIASCLHPKFKLNWIHGEEKTTAKNYLEDLFGIHSADCEISPTIEEKLDDHDDFFAFNKQTKEIESVQEELYRFLKSSNCNISMLNDYSTIKKHFIKYNTALPSSASVERIFSVGGSVITPQRGHLLDDIIEYQILLKCNKNFY